MTKPFVPRSVAGSQMRAMLKEDHEKKAQIKMTKPFVPRSAAGSKMRAMLKEDREKKASLDALNRDMIKHNQLIQEANDALVENKLRILILSIHLGDDYPLRTRRVFVPPLTEGFLPIIDTCDTHFFSIGPSDHDYDTVHYCDNNEIPISTIDQEKNVLKNCARYIWEREINNYDVVVMTDNENFFLDIIMLTQRMQYIASRPLQYKQGWGNLDDSRWAVTTNYLKTLIPTSSNLESAALIPSTTYLIALPNRSERERKRIRNRILIENGVTFHIDNHIEESQQPSCVHPAAIIVIINQKKDFIVADTIRQHMLHTFSCDHHFFLVDNGIIGNARWRGIQVGNDENNGEEADTFVSVRIHSRRSNTFAMKMGIRAADAVGKLRRRPFDAYGIMDVERLDFDETSLQHGWLSKLIDQMYNIDAGMIAVFLPPFDYCLLLYFISVLTYFLH
jgi:hypothetical protein